MFSPTKQQEDNESNFDEQDKEYNSIKNDEEWDIEEAREALRKATFVLSHRCLKLACKWAAEQLVGIRKNNKSRGPVRRRCYMEEELENHSDDELYAKSLLDLGEYERSASCLSENEVKDEVVVKEGNGSFGSPLPNLSSFGIYIRAYALYLAGERRKEEETTELLRGGDPLGQCAVMNNNLIQLRYELSKYYSDGKLDAFGLYVYGMVLKALQKYRRSSSSLPGVHFILIESIIKYPYNWSAWLDLANHCVEHPNIYPSVEKLLEPLGNHWMYHYFLINVFLEQQQNEQALVLINNLSNSVEDGSSDGLFDNSSTLQAQTALAYYNLRDFGTAQEHFLHLRSSDPYRLDHMDIYSNILYVNEAKSSLSQLSHAAISIDKYRPETCCIIGNYYSLKSQHEKAVQYFSRALKLDRTYLSAWTLMGHEFVEMKNTPAAMEAYRRAVDINPRDYRAWYGLGQTYEILNMLLYALFYYRKATSLRPYDARMWCAMGGCYLGLHQKKHAIRAFERALANYDREGVATRKLASLYRESGQEEKAAWCYMRHLQIRSSTTPNQLNNTTIIMEEQDDVIFPSLPIVDACDAEAVLYLAFYHKNHGNLDIAGKCCTRLLEYPGPEKEEAKALLREIRSRMDSCGAAGITSSSSFEFSP